MTGPEARGWRRLVVEHLLKHLEATAAGKSVDIYMLEVYEQISTKDEAIAVLGEVYEVICLLQQRLKELA